jgi:hypothetical protein
MHLFDSSIAFINGFPQRCRYFFWNGFYLIILLLTIYATYVSSKVIILEPSRWKLATSCFICIETPYLAAISIGINVGNILSSSLYDDALHTASKLFVCLLLVVSSPVIGIIAASYFVLRTEDIPFIMAFFTIQIMPLICLQTMRQMQKKTT